MRGSTGTRRVPFRRHRERGILIAHAARLPEPPAAGAGIVRAMPLRTPHDALRAARLREHLERALARPPPDERAEPPREVEQLGQRKPRPQRPARHARRCGSARRRLEARRSSQRTNGRACGHALGRRLVSRFAAGAARVRRPACAAPRAARGAPRGLGTRAHRPRAKSPATMASGAAQAAR